MNRLPRRALTNEDIMKYANNNIPYFRGVYMRDNLPLKPKPIECSIVNLDSSNNPGTHWVAFVKIYKYCEYFNSYGDLKPPAELVKYLRDTDLYYNYTKYQTYNTYNCGHLCLQFLKGFWEQI